jgi:hypothetical protein
MGVRLVLLAAAACLPAACGVWKNLTVFHTNQANYSAGDIADMNTADDLGDLEFTVRAKLLPLECSDPAFAHHASYDCANPEQDATNLAITKLIIQVDSEKVGGYCPCNVHAGKYSCGSFHHGGAGGGSGCAGFGAVPVGEFLGRFYNASRYNSATPDFEWYGVNTLQRFGSGMWYSTVGKAQCGLPSSPSNCSWRIAEVVKRVSRNCSDGVQEAAVRAADSKAKTGGGCFTRCPQATNTSSPCWIKCYFDTLLGAGAGKTTRYSSPSSSFVSTLMKSDVYQVRFRINEQKTQIKRAFHHTQAVASLGVKAVLG